MEPLIQETITTRVQTVLTKIRSAEEKAGRLGGSVRLVAATKTVMVDHIAEGCAPVCPSWAKIVCRKRVLRYPRFLRRPCNGILSGTSSGGRYGQ